MIFMKPNQYIHLLKFKIVLQKFSCKHIRIINNFNFTNYKFSKVKLTDKDIVKGQINLDNIWKIKTITRFNNNCSLAIYIIRKFLISFNNNLLVTYYRVSPKIRPTPKISPSLIFPDNRNISPSPKIKN